MLIQMQSKNAKLVSSKVWCSSNESESKIRDISDVQGCLGRVEKFSAFYLVGIAKEFVNGHLGSRDLPKYHS